MLRRHRLARFLLPLSGKFLVHLRDRARYPERGAIGKFIQRRNRLIFSVRDSVGIGIKRMSSNVKTQQLLFVAHILPIAPWHDGPRPSRRNMLVGIPEKRYLPRHSIAMRYR